MKTKRLITVLCAAVTAIASALIPLDAAIPEIVTDAAETKTFGGFYALFCLCDRADFSGKA